MTVDNKLKRIYQTIESLESFQQQAKKVIENQQKDDVFDPSVSVDDDFESVVEILNRLHEHVKLIEA
ncbi:hypothetical protein [Shewanella frigidimarina]|uniref:hypothetical protein n=1 Tax=Shewanella frigidimarina TaxID=56812 RepID=UPI003D7B9C29